MFPREPLSEVSTVEIKTHREVDICPVDVSLERLPSCCQAELLPTLPPRPENQPPGPFYTTIDQMLVPVNEKELKPDDIKNHRQPLFETSVPITFPSQEGTYPS